MRAPRYAPDSTALEQLAGQAKQWTCPYCGRAGTLNGHGLLRGGAEEAHGKDAVRGRRWFCSNRGRRPGCGRTFSVLLAQVMRHASVRTAKLWQFCRARLAGGGVPAAWEQTRCGFSLEAAYQWWRRWRRAEPALRTHLLRGPGPPGKSLREQIERAYGAIDPIAWFQKSEQRPWPGFAS